MQRQFQDQAIRQASERLVEILQKWGRESSVRYDANCRGSSFLFNSVVTAGRYFFALEWKSSGALGPVAHAVQQLKRETSDLPCSVIPLVAVPYMGEAGRAHCEQYGVGWLDLSGNTSIVAPGLYVEVLGHANRYRRPGRVESAFGPKGSRIARWLLMHPTEAARQRDLAVATGLDEGYVSRVIRKLAESELVVRRAGGIAIGDANRLLDAWHEEYRFDRHRLLIPGHIAATSGDSLTRGIARTLTEGTVPYAVTGLAAAWAWTRYTSFRLSTVYLEEMPSTGLTRALGFREEARGANTWLVVPNDAGVFHGADEVEGIRCVHPVQAYLDLKAHPERAQEAADEIRSQFLPRGDDAW